MSAIGKIEIIAPSFKISRGDLAQCREFLKQSGLEFNIPQNLFGAHTVSANSVEIRLAQLKRALSAKDSDMVWFLRGGYGLIHLLPGLSAMKRPKWKLCMGYSDITSFLIFAVQNWNWRAIHGPMLDGVAQHAMNEASRRKVIRLFNQGIKDRFEFKLKPLKRRGRGEISGQILGGNLVVAGSTLGTPFQLSGKGRILFFEDIGERGYQVDRVLVQMEQAGVFQSCRAVVFGRFSDSAEPGGGDKVKAVLQDFASRQKFSVFSNLAIGHGRIQNMIPVGVPAVITTDNKLVCRWEE